MNNPFEMLDVRLSTIESLLINLKHGLPISPKEQNEQPIGSKELCNFLNITFPTLLRYRKKGKIPFLQVGSRILYQKSAVIEALEGNKKKGAIKI